MTDLCIRYTQQQSDAIGMAVDAVRSGNRLFRIGGYAGTGKTTISKAIIHALGGSPAVCAFTGKASSVLRSKGLDAAQTIHKTIYEFNPKTERFVLKKWVDGDYFILDEASMVSARQWHDMQSFDLPIVAIGDPGQLEPVGEDPRLMENPDVVLSEIHRQDADSAIIQFASHVRFGKSIRRGRKGEVEIGDRELFENSLEWADILLCGRNKTRVRINNQIRRRRYGNDSKRVLLPMERVICLANNSQLGVNNGEIYVVETIYEESPAYIKCDLSDCDGDVLPDVVLEKKFFGVEKPKREGMPRGKTMCVDYGYCTSVHKFQGSEADRVAVLEEQCDLWDPVRWSYTAITRAAKELRYSI